MVGFHNRNVLEVTDGIESSVAEQAAYFLVGTFYAVTAQESIHRIGNVITFGQRSYFVLPVGEGCRTFAVIDTDTGQRTEGDKRKAVLIPVEVRTFQQC